MESNIETSSVVNNPPLHLSPTCNDDNLTSSNKNYCSMVNVGMDPSNNNFFTYYIPPGSNSNNTSNSSNNPNPNSNNLPSQQNFVDEQQPSIPQLSLNANQVKSATNGPLPSQMQHMSQMQQLQQIQQLPQSEQYMFIESMKDQQLHHQLPTQSTTNIEPTSMLGFPTSSQIQNQQMTLPNNSSVASQMYLHKRHSSGSAMMRSNYMEPYIPTMPHATSMENVASNLNLPPYQNFMLQFSGNSQVSANVSSIYSKASPITVLWLLENYEPAEGVSLPRCLLYSHYIMHSRDQGKGAINAASFGKLIRSLYPNLKTRRLGTRGKSKYHYYGIRIRESSILHTYGNNEEEVIAYLKRENAPYEDHRNRNSSRQFGSSSIQSNSQNISGDQSPHSKKELITKSTCTSTDNISVINIALGDISRRTPPFITVNEINDGQSTNSNVADDIIGEFKISEFASYFPKGKIESIHSTVIPEYPTLKCFYVDFNETEIALNESFGVEGDSNSTFSFSEFEISSVSELITKIKFVLKRCASIQINLVSDLDAKTFINCVDTDLNNLIKQIESQFSKTEISAADSFDSDDVISLINELDVMLYQSLIHQLFPKIFMYFPSQYICRVRIFTKQLEKVVCLSSKKFSPRFKNSKIANVKAFGHIIRHYTCLNHLYNGAVNSMSPSKQSLLCKEILKIDSNQIIRQHGVHFLDCTNRETFVEAVQNLIKILQSPPKSTTLDLSVKHITEAEKEEFAKSFTANIMESPFQSQFQFQPHFQPQSQLLPQLQSQLIPQLQSQLLPQLQSQLQMQPQLQPQLQSQLQMQPQLQSQIQMQPQLQSQIQMQPQLLSQPQSQFQPQLQSQPQSQFQPQLQLQPQSQLQPQLQSQLQPQLPWQLAPQLQSQLGPQLQSQLQWQPQTVNDETPQQNPMSIKMENVENVQTEHVQAEKSENVQSEDVEHENSQIIENVVSEGDRLVQEILNWAKNIKETLFKKPEQEDNSFTLPEYYEAFCKFIAAWNHMIILVVRELTLQGSSVFGLIHILHLLLFEYIIFLMEYDVFKKYEILPMSLYTKADIEHDKKK